MDPSEKNRFGAWKMIIPNNNNQLVLCNAINLWFIMIRIYSKFTVLISMLKNPKFKPKKKKSKSEKIEIEKPTKKNSFDKINFLSEKKENLKTECKKLNWKYFSENFKFPSIFIKDWNFLDEVIKPILFDNKICNYFVTFSTKFLQERKKDKILEKTIKSCLRIFIAFKRNLKRDSHILDFLYELVSLNSNLIKKSNIYIYT